MIWILSNGQSRKNIESDNVSINGAQKESSLSIVEFHNGDFGVNDIFVQPDLDSFFDWPDLYVFPWTDVNL